MACFFISLDKLNAAISKKVELCKEMKQGQWPICRRVMASGSYALSYEYRIRPNDPRVFVAYLEGSIPVSDRAPLPGADQALINKIDPKFDFASEIDGEALEHVHQTVVCKILTSKYGVYAHKALWSVDLAPRLFVYRQAFGTKNCEHPIELGYHLAVMDRVEEVINPDPRACVEELLRLKAVLDSNELVHGDLRDANLIFYTDVVGQTKLHVVDFDWAGREGEVFYPHNMKIVPHARHIEAQPGTVIKREHDTYMLDKLIDMYSGRFTSRAQDMDVDGYEDE
uniref:Crinkler family protein n=1 Tax=Mycena chlorophos TaxID=658473 RepID=A0ABQ0KYB1_MYCCL|nr:crinkler family protein [Mycena chlorophos]